MNGKGDKSRYNPANVNVTIVEIKHEPDRFDLRGGAKLLNTLIFWEVLN